MSFARVRLIVLFVILFLLAGLSVMNVAGLICPPSLMASVEGDPVITIREDDFLCTGISQIVSDDSSIYVLYGQYGVVQAYTHDGVYQYSISVVDHLNGRAEIAVVQNRLYICDKKSNLYVFEDGALTQYLDRKESYDTRKRLSLGAWSGDYTVKSGSVWFAPDGVPSHCVIRRPAWLGLYQNDGLWMLMFLLVAMSGGILMLPKKKTAG